MESSDLYRFPKLKGNENYESWKVDIISALKAKGLWWVTSEKMEKPEIPPFDVTSTVKRAYNTDMLAWEDKNDRACEMIVFSIEQRPCVHIENIKGVIEMWVILKNQYEQSNLIIIHLIIKKLIQTKQLNFKFIHEYVNALKRVFIKCASIENSVFNWMLDHFFLLNFNEELKSYIFELIQSIKINNFILLIKSMIIALTDHNKRINHEKTFKSLTVKFKKKFNFRNNNQIRINYCKHCCSLNHTKEKCFFLNFKLRSEE